MRQARPDLLLVALFMQFGSTTVSAYRWQLIMRNLHFGQSLSFYWRSYFKAMFFNQGLPTSIGGDALRVLDVAGQGFRKRDALYGVMLDRIAGLAALMWLNLIAYMFSPDLLPDPIYHLTLLLVVGSLAGFAGRVLSEVSAVARRLSQTERGEDDSGEAAPGLSGQSQPVDCIIAADPRAGHAEFLRDRLGAGSAL
ncbi:MAG: flippase-like domain-containing protein [Chromatiales bacterium]|nr:flippase-like domain-containing protein [Chromatiales bacterium]